MRGDRRDAAVWLAAALMSVSPLHAVGAAGTAYAGVRTDVARTQVSTAQSGQETQTQAAQTAQTAQVPGNDAPAQAVSAQTAYTHDAPAAGKPVTLRICSWEEYIDEGGWGEDEVIDLESGDIFGENPMIDDFEAWYEQTYGVQVNVEYSTFGTNEDLYNMLTLGDTYDLVCPSEYMFMKLISEDRAVPLSDAFFDEDYEYNYYIKGVSPYLRAIFDDHEIDGEPWSRYAAGFMWGVTGIVYNPNLMTREEASTWNVLTDPAYRRRITIKDSVRECYFAAVGALNSELLTSDAFRNDPNYAANLEEVMNDTSPEMIARVQDWLQQVKDNVYSFEVDSGKADMVTGKVAANYQWSGDAVYTMDQAKEDDFDLEFAVPHESSDIYFDGWLMLKSGIGGDAAKQHAAEAFINFVSRPDNAVRNMYYIGYTSFISGGDDPTILEYMDWSYGAEEDEESPVEYDVTYFFTGDTEESDEDYILTVPEEQLYRQLGAQYPSREDIERTCIMRYFDAAQSEATNRMWVNVRCFNINNLPWWGWLLTAAGAAGVAWMAIRRLHIARRLSEAEKAGQRMRATGG